jgi:hypothetical protein
LLALLVRHAESVAPGTSGIDEYTRPLTSLTLTFSRHGERELKSDDEREAETRTLPFKLLTGA